MLFLTAAGVGGLVLALIAWSVVRHRSRKGVEPATFSEHVRLELFYTAVPVVIVAVLFAVTMVAQRDVNRLAPAPAVRVEATGFQWGWRFLYLTQGVSVVGTSVDPPTLVLPVGATTRLTLVSPDVIHSFWVPGFLVKRDVVPGLPNRIDVTPTRTGRFAGVCAEFCGLDHAAMTFTVEVVEPPQFEAFVARLRQEQPGEGSTPPPTGGIGDPGGRAAGAGRR